MPRPPTEGERNHNAVSRKGGRLGEGRPQTNQEREGIMDIGTLGRMAAALKALDDYGFIIVRRDDLTGYAMEIRPAKPGEKYEVSVTSVAGGCLLFYREGGE